MCFFFKQKTSYEIRISDWSSDVCSSDLFWGAKTLLSAVELGLFTELATGPLDGETLRRRLGLHERSARDFFDALVALRMLDRRDGRYANTAATDVYRSEERRVGKECVSRWRTRWSTYHKKKKKEK